MPKGLSVPKGDGPKPTMRLVPKGQTLYMPKGLSVPKGDGPKPTTALFSYPPGFRCWKRKEGNCKAARRETQRGSS